MSKRFIATVRGQEKVEELPKLEFFVEVEEDRVCFRCNHDGHPWLIASISPDTGAMRRARYLSRDIGLALDDDRCIVLEDD